MNGPLVTVIAVCYNHGRFVPESLESIRRQTYRRIELIIADDCSTDDSVQRIVAWVNEHDVECQLLLHDRNLGLCRTLNEALSIAKGKYVAMLATDDMWVPEKIARQVARMEGLPESVAVLYSDARVIDEYGHVLPGRFLERFELPDMPQGNIFPFLLREWSFILPMTTLIRRSSLDEVGPYDETLVFEDLDMWLRLARHHDVVFDPGVTGNYRIHAGSMVRSHSAEIAKSSIRIFSKWLGEAEFARTVERRIGEQWWTLTQLEPEHRWSHARFALRAHRGPRAYIKLLFLALGIPFDRLTSLAALLRRLRRAGRGGPRPSSVRVTVAAISPTCQDARDKRLFTARQDRRHR